MLTKLRKPLLFVAVILILLVVLIESGSSCALPLPDVSDAELQEIVDDSKDEDSDIDVSLQDLKKLRDEKEAPPGLGIPYMAMLDFLVLFTILLVVSPLLIGDRLHARIQGIATLIVSLLVLIASFAMIFVALGLLILMVSLFLAVPFGTIAYMAIYGFFPKGSAAAVLSLLMMLKLGFGAFLLFAHQRFLQNKGLVLILVTSLVANLIVAFLHGFVPSFLVSITDALAAIIVAILALIWALFYFIFSIVAVIKALRLRRSN